MTSITWLPVSSLSPYPNHFWQPAQMSFNVALRRAANILQQAPAHTKEKIAQELRQETGEQTARMATAIIANAIIFHTRIEGQQGIPTLTELQTETGVLSRNKLVECWRWIVMEINYWPIFKIASDLLSLIPTQQAGNILKRLCGDFRYTDRAWCNRH